MGFERFNQSKWEELEGRDGQCLWRVSLLLCLPGNLEMRDQSGLTGDSSGLQYFVFFFFPENDHQLFWMIKIQTHLEAEEWTA